MRGRFSIGLLLAVISFVIYVVTTLSLSWTWDTQYCCEQNSFSVAASNILFGTRLGTIKRQISDFLLSHQNLPLGLALADVQALPLENASDQLFPTTFDGNGIGYPLVATAAFQVFGLHAWAPLLTMLLLMALATAAFLWRFGGSLAYVVTLYFVSLTAMLFTAIVWEPVYRSQIPVAGIRYFSLISMLPTMHILLHLFTREATGPRGRRRDYVLLGVQAAVLTIAVLVRSSAASLFGAIALAWLVQFWRSNHLTPMVCNATVIGTVVVGLGVALVLVMPEEYRTEGRVGTVVWHRVVASLDLNPAFPFPGINDMFADCQKRLPGGLRRSGGDANAGCVWIDYQLKHGLPIDGLGQDLFNREYEKVLEKQFFKIAARYPGEVLSTFFYYKPRMLLPAIKNVLRTNFANDAKLTAIRDDPNYMSYPPLAVGLLILALAVGALHLAILGATNLALVAGIALWAALWTIPPYIVAWASPATIADFVLYCLFLVALVFAGLAAGVGSLAGRRGQASDIPA